MEKITFKAGYGDPTRTIAQKYGDYHKIDELIKDIDLRNSKLRLQLEDLESKKASLAESFQHIVGMDATKTKEQIQELTNQINSIKDEIESNRSLKINAWYGFHERF